MQILIEIPNPPKRQEIVDIPLHFIDGDVCEAGGYEFKVLSPHGRLIDGDKLRATLRRWTEDEWNQKASPVSWAYAYEDLIDLIDDAPTILEAETED